MENDTLAMESHSTSFDIHVQAYVKSVGFLFCFWIIVSHSFIIFCFTVNRFKPWTSYSKQILSLSINDLCVGIVCLLLLVLFSIETGVNYSLCSTTFFVFFAALCACLYHVSAICIYRALMLMKKPNKTTPTSYKLSVVLVALAWITSFCLSAIPFILWHKNEHTIVLVCIINTVFTDDLESAMGFFAVCYLAPLILTNIVYAITCCKLMTVWRKIFPSGAPETMASVAENVLGTLDRPSHITRSGVTAQRRAVGTMGVLLFLFDLFSIPLIVVMCARFSGVTPIPRMFRILASIAFIMNSVTSPFVYATRTKFLRDAMKDIVKDCLSCSVM